METRRLQAFIRMVDTGSLTRAAKVLNIAQPALSQQVAALEAHFGVALLTRGRQGVEPTPAGRTLYRHAQIILKQLEQTEIDVKLTSDQVSGSVHVGLPLSAAAILSVPLLRATNLRYPNVKLAFADGLPGNLLNEFAMNGRLDIALLPGNVSARGVDAQPLLTERLALVSSPELAIGASDGPISLVELEGHPILLPHPGNRVRDAVDTAFASIGLQPNVVGEMDSVFSLCAAAAANLGSAIVPLAAARQAGYDLSIRPVVDPEIERPIYLAVAKGVPLSSAAQAIKSLIIEVSAELIELGAWPGAHIPKHTAHNVAL